MNAKRKSIRKKERQMIYKKYHGICQICGTEISYEEMTIDHIIPLDAGGKNELANYQCTCRVCNSMNIKVSELVAFAKIFDTDFNAFFKGL